MDQDQNVVILQNLFIFRGHLWLAAHILENCLYVSARWELEFFQDRPGHKKTAYLSNIHVFKLNPAENTVLIKLSFGDEAGDHARGNADLIEAIEKLFGFLQAGGDAGDCVEHNPFL